MTQSMHYYASRCNYLSNSSVLLSLVVSSSYSISPFSWHAFKSDKCQSFAFIQYVKMFLGKNEYKSNPNECVNLKRNSFRTIHLEQAPNKKISVHISLHYIYTMSFLSFFKGWDTGQLGSWLGKSSACSACVITTVSDWIRPVLTVAIGGVELALQYPGDVWEGFSCRW